MPIGVECPIRALRSICEIGGLSCFSRPTMGVLWSMLPGPIRNSLGIVLILKTIISRLLISFQSFLFAYAAANARAAFKGQLICQISFVDPMVPAGHWL